MHTIWDPQQYLRFADERARPFGELVGRIGAGPADIGDIARVVDLGCGPATLTVGLSDRYPAAEIIGVESSADMVAAALAGATHPRLHVEVGDLRTWEPTSGPGSIDVIVTNATLQWVPDHLLLLPRLVGLLRPGGWIGLQVPGNLDDPHHRAIETLCRSDRWSSTLGDAPNRGLVSFTALDYADALAAAGCDSLDAWTTEYVHVLSGPDPVLEWVKGTGLRPVLSRLDTDGAAQFCSELAPMLRAAFPERAWGTPFPFRRVFAVARRSR